MNTVQADVTGNKAPITITIKTATELSGLSRPTINRRIWSGELKTTHVGSRHLIFFDSFQKMLGLSTASDAA
jgi:excisionase family DNA binding protein